MHLFETFPVYEMIVVSVDLCWRKEKKSWLGLDN